MKFLDWRIQLRIDSERERMNCCCCCCRAKKERESERAGRIVFAVRQKTLTERSVREKKGKFHARHFLRAPLQTTTTTTQQPMGNKAGSAENKNQTVKRKEEKRRRFIDAHYWESCWHLVHDFTKKEENERARSLSAHGRPFKSI